MRNGLLADGFMALSSIQRPGSIRHAPQSPRRLIPQAFRRNVGQLRILKGAAEKVIAHAKYIPQAPKRGHIPNDLRQSGTRALPAIQPLNLSDIREGVTTRYRLSGTLPAQMQTEHSKHSTLALS
jgi:hypothetical protein